MAVAVANQGGDNVHRLAVELDEEEQELWKQLRRKRDFENRVVEKRAQLQELRDRRRKTCSQHAEVTASVEHLTEEVSFANEQEKEVEHDICVLTESNRILQQAFAQQHGSDPRQAGGHPGSQNMDPSAILAEEKNRQESIQLQHEQIAHLRAHLEKLRAEKGNLQHRQQILFEKQRSAEQDRNRLLGTLQDDRSAINEVRQERIHLWEERSRMEREMAQIVHEAQSGTNGGASMLKEAQVPGTSGGVRGHVTMDTPEAFAPSSGMGQATRGGTQQKGWTGFGSEQPPASGVGNPSGGYSGGGAAPFYGESGPGTRSPELPSRDEGHPGAGITEWAGKLQTFRGGSSRGF